VIHSHYSFILLTLLIIEKFLEEGVSYPTMAQKGQSVLHLSVLEPEPGGVHLERCIPNLIMKMYPAAKTLQCVGFDIFL
jgi:hypothetical protein